MRIITHKTFGTPADVLQIEDTPIPTPAAGEVLVRMTKRPIPRGVLLQVRGRYRAPGQEGAKPEQPTLLGIEGVGVVEQVGRDVDSSRGLVPGARVAFFPVPGAWNDYAVAPAQWVTAMPKDLSDDVAAQLHLNPLAALMLLRDAQAAGADPDAPIVVDAATSSVSKLVAALAKNKGIPITGIVRRQGQSVNLSDFDHVVSAERSDCAEQLRAASKGAGFKVGLVAVGGRIGTEIFGSLSLGGTLITYGDLSGDPMQINALEVAARMLNIRGMLYLTWMGLSDEQRAADVAMTVDLARKRPDLFPVAAEYPLTEIKKAATEAEVKTKKSGLVLVHS